MLSVQSFNDYRKFLREYYLARKASAPGYTYARFSEEAGLGAPNYLKLVIDEKRNLTVANIHQFALAMNLSRSDHQYFEALVLLNQARGTPDREFYEQRLSPLRAGRPKKTIRSQSPALVSQWFVPAALLSLHERPTAEVRFTDLSRKLGVPAAQLESAIEQMKKINLLKVQDGRFLVDFNHAVYHDPKTSNLLQQKYLQAQVERSMLAARRRSDPYSKLFSHTFTMSRAAFQKYRDEVREFLDRMTAVSEGDPAEAVAQINIQLFVV